MKIIGIAGGSGSGKSTVSYALVDSDPKQFEVVNLDDYQKLKTDSALPMVAGVINWDHPDIIEWDKLISAVKHLKSRKPVTINVWAHRSNPDYATTGIMIERIIYPKPVIIVEGNLALYHPELNKLYDKTYYLNLPQETRLARRDKNAIPDQQTYLTTVLEPMHRQYVEPTKHNAEVIIDVSSLSVDTLKQRLLADLELHS